VGELAYLDRGPFSFMLEEGECVGLSGQSGIGKSQLLRAVADIIPSQGTVALQGVPCSAYPAPQWRKLVSLVPAEPAWWFDRVGDHFVRETDFEQLLARVEMFDFSPEVLSWQIHRLSTGEKQRLGLLRSLQNQPKVLLLDEPSSALDRHHTLILEEFIARLRRETRMAVLWISHDQEQLARVAERVLVMEKNRMYEENRCLT